MNTTIVYNLPSSQVEEPDTARAVTEINKYVLDVQSIFPTVPPTSTLVVTVTVSQSSTAGPFRGVVRGVLSVPPAS